MEKVATPLTDRLFPPDIEDGLLLSQDSNTLDAHAIVQDAMASVRLDNAEASSGTKTLTMKPASVVSNITKDFRALFGLTPSPKQQPKRHLGPNGFVMAEINGQLVETDEPNLLFANAAFLQEKELERVNLEAQKLAEKKKAKAAAAVAKKQAKAKAKAEAKAEAKPQAKPNGKPKAKAKAEARAKTKAKSSPSVDAEAPVNPELLQAHPCGKYYINLKLTTAVTGICRTYLTGVASDGKRRLITELTKAHNPEHVAVMQILQNLVSAENFTKEQAVAWRNSQQVQQAFL